MKPNGRGIGMPLLVSCIVVIASLAGCSGSSDDRYSNDDGYKGIGMLAMPPIFVDPESPTAGAALSITIEIPGATAIAFTASGPGCGTIAATAGGNPLVVTGAVADKGYCDLTATATAGVDQVYEGRFEVAATEPDLPPFALAEDDIWEQAALPEATEGGPVITDLSVPGEIESGSDDTFTLVYTDDEDVVGIFLRFENYPHGYLFTPADGSDGQAAFAINVDPDFFDEWGATGHATVDLTLVAVDAAGRFSEPFIATFEVGEPASGSLAAALGDAATSYRVKGTVRYEKFIATRAGLDQTRGRFIPVRQAIVKVISKADNTTVLGQGTTGEDGTFDISFANGTDSTSYVVRVYTTSTALNQSVVNLKREVYAIDSAEVDMGAEPAKTGLAIDIPADTSAGAFNIWDICARANVYARSSAGSAPPAIAILWEKGKNPSADPTSYYQKDDGSGNSVIGIMGKANDPDEYDDMVIGHEYGHFTMDKYSRDDSPGGDHEPSTPADPTLALSESWATFVGGAALGKSEYIDTNPGGSTFFSFETPPADFPRGTANGAIADKLSEIIPVAVLWDLFDTTNETMDTLQSNNAAIWKVATTYLKDGYAKFVDRGATGRDLVDFLDGWICLGFGQVGAKDTEGLRGAAIGLMKLPADFIKSDLASCK